MSTVIAVALFSFAPMWLQTIVHAKLIPNKGFYTRTTSVGHRPSSDVYYVPGCRPESYPRLLAPVKVSREEARQTIRLWRLWVLVWNSFYFLQCKKLRSECRQIAAIRRQSLCPQPDDVVRAYPRETQEMVIDAHERAFASFRGACARASAII